MDMGIPVGVSKTEYGMDMWTVMNPCGDSVKFSNGREIKRKRIKQVSVFQFRQMQPSLQFVVRAFFFMIIAEYTHNNTVTCTA